MNGLLALSSALQRQLCGGRRLKPGTPGCPAASPAGAHERRLCRVVASPASRCSAAAINAHVPAHHILPAPLSPASTAGSGQAGGQVWSGLDCGGSGLLPAAATQVCDYATMGQHAGVPSERVWLLRFPLPSNGHFLSSMLGQPSQSWFLCLTYAAVSRPPWRHPAARGASAAHLSRLWQQRILPHLTCCNSWCCDPPASVLHMRWRCWTVWRTQYSKRCWACWSILVCSVVITKFEAPPFPDMLILKHATAMQLR